MWNKKLVYAPFTTTTGRLTACLFLLLAASSHAVPECSPGEYPRGTQVDLGECRDGTDLGTAVCQSECCSNSSFYRTKVQACKDHGGVSIKGPDLSPRKGMTWAKARHNSKLGTDFVTCHVAPKCNPYQGDTSCAESLPILCISTDNSPNPGIQDGKFRSWAAGHIATTTAIQGQSLGSYQDANQACIDAFGPGWRMAQHHDGVEARKRGWMFEAYGNVRTDTRFWVYIKDRKGNCWDGSPQPPTPGPPPGEVLQNQSGLNNNFQPLRRKAGKSGQE